MVYSLFIFFILFSNTEFEQINKKTLIFVIGSKGVHGWGQVGFVPNPDPTRTIRVGENQNRNQPVLMVG